MLFALGLVWGLQLTFKLCGYLYVRQDYIRYLRLKQYRPDSGNPKRRTPPSHTRLALKSILRVTRKISLLPIYLINLLITQ